MKSDKPTPEGVFWMVWDDSGNLGERILCPTKSWENEIRSDNREGTALGRKCAEIQWPPVFGIPGAGN